MHMTGIGGLCGSFLLLSVIWPIDLRLILATLFLVAGIIGTARLILNVHTPAQVAAGFFAGILPQVSLFLLI
jgi:membrane-associated phospholipid phosphatase